MLTRRPDWQNRLTRFFVTHWNAPFLYGSWDCCLWVSSAIDEMTGVDPALQFRNQYRTRIEAYKAIKAATGKASVQSVVERITSTHEMPEISVRQAQCGDVVLIKRARDYSLGLVAFNWNDIVVCHAQGLYHISLNYGLRAWRV